MLDELIVSIPQKIENTSRDNVDQPSGAGGGAGGAGAGQPGPRPREGGRPRRDNRLRQPRRAWIEPSQRLFR